MVKNDTDMQSPATPRLSLAERAANLDSMSCDTFDIAVIGGGITGAGIALDAASRGMSVALIEKRDFASGTSSRSTKLIHGGLRYLEQMEFGLVRESLRERETLTRLAPHLSEPLAFLIPVYAKGTPSPLGRNRLKLRLGLWLYDLLAGSRNIARHRWLTPEAVLQLAPGLESRGLEGGFLYYDCVTDDARLVVEVMKMAAAYGASAANYASAQGFVKTGGRVSGIEVEDALDGRQFTLRARIVVNATGVWADEVTKMDQQGAEKKIRPSKGIHLVLPTDKLNNRAAVLIPSLGEQRFLFAVPWQGRVIIGTTDADYTGDLDEPSAEKSEVNRILESAARYFPGAGLTNSDVISTFAGLRPLVSSGGKATKDVSRREMIFESDSGLISIVGGKLTAWRSMAERVTDLAARRLGNSGKCITEKIPLAGGPALEPDREMGRAAAEFGITKGTVEHLIRAYGGNYRTILEIARESAELRANLVSDLPHIEAEVIYAARYEMAATVEDFLARRTRIALLARDHGHSCALRVAELMGRELGWSSAQVQSALAEYVA
ncbi:MAG TPA: glycerol-3-phosphate dehydrogenase [Blastocatellia bacterium]|nr:glycerol-3-phosphate dehydrogenase [Blastocatellia bacterium]